MICVPLLLHLSIAYEKSLFKISILALHLKLHARLPISKSDKLVFLFVMLV
jgi:hypothetical protein